MHTGGHGHDAEASQGSQTGPLAAAKCASRNDTAYIPCTACNYVTACPASKCSRVGSYVGTHGEAQCLEQQLVSQHVNSQLLITEAVHAGCASAGGSADLVGTTEQQHNTTASSTCLYRLQADGVCRGQQSSKVLGQHTVLPVQIPKQSPYRNNHRCTRTYA